MAGPLANKQFNQLWSTINLEIENDHKNYWPRVKGYLANAVGRHSAGGLIAGVALKGASAAVSYLVKQVPLLGTAITTTASFAAQRGREYWLERKMKDPSTTDKEYMSATNDWWVQKGMQAYVDAARKYDEAVKAYMRIDIVNCAAYRERLAKFLYARYRLRRLESYHAMMVAFQQQMAQKLEETRKEWDRLVQEAQIHGPDFFDKGNEEWHFASCKDTCMYPLRGDVGISRPTNVQGHPPPLPPRPGR